MAHLIEHTGGQVPYHHFSAAPARYGALPTGGDIANPGASAWDVEGAVARVTFEALERYCAAFADYASLTLAEPDVSSPVWSVGMRIQRFADDQYAAPDFPFVPVDSNSLIHWAAGRSLLTGRGRFIPAPLVYLPYRPSTTAETLGYSFSTGMSAAWRRDDACLGGLLELVERDAFVTAWMNRIPGAVLVPRPGSALANRVNAVEASGGGRVTMTDLTSDLGIPVVCCVLRRPAHDRAVIAVGLSCKMDYASACDKALCESVSEYERLRTVLEDSHADNWVPGDAFCNVTDFDFHGRTYLDEKLHPQLDFLLGDGTERVINGEFRNQTSADLFEAMRRVGPHVSDIVAVDLTTRDVHELGVCVVKVFAPELVPLNADHRYPYLGHKRLYTAGGRLATASVRANLNPYPHPFS
ncbi:MAG: YcaO-like family protein [Bifidobacteriaceae bacterium]|jgi:ribosomal protein S12 methylthiotransferase accessory factor|nr:YcaO-like family protein [Bifidobacteriaceae bacterium]